MMFHKLEQLSWSIWLSLLQQFQFDGCEGVGCWGVCACVCVCVCVGGGGGGVLDEAGYIYIVLQIVLD